MSVLSSLLLSELERHYRDKPITLETWPSIITTALSSFDDILHEQSPKERKSSLSFPELDTKVSSTEEHFIGTKVSLFDQSMQRLMYNQEVNYIVPILHAIEALIAQKSFPKTSEEMYTFLDFLFKSSGPALIEVIGESYYKQHLVRMDRRNSIRIFKRHQSQLLYNKLLEDTKEKHVDLASWPLLIAVGKEYADKSFEELEEYSRKQIIVEALSHLIEHLATENVDIRTSKQFILSNITPILNILSEKHQARILESRGWWSWCRCKRTYSK